MPLSLSALSQRLTASGILSADALTEFLSNLPEGQQPTDGEQLAQMLVRQGQLTKFQAEEIYAGRTLELVLGNYVLLEKLGQGDMGLVYKALHRRMERIVALKVLSHLAVETPGLVERFHCEAKAAAKLSHPNIVTAHDADESQGTHFLVMEFVPGDDLATVVHQNGPLPVREAVEIILQAARGLDYAHQQGVVHRDIKPGNLLLSDEGTVKVLDLALARVHDTLGGSPDALTTTGSVRGTVDYMSPEQAEYTKHADARSDIYSLGCTFFFVLTARPVFIADTMMKRLLAHRDAACPDLMQLRNDVPVRVNAIFQRMVAKHPDDRFQTMAEVADALDVMFEELSSPSAAERTTLDAPPRTFVTEAAEVGNRGGQGHTAVIPEHGFATVASADQAMAATFGHTTEQGTVPTGLPRLATVASEAPAHTGPPSMGSRWIRVSVVGLGLLVLLGLIFSSAFGPRRTDNQAASDGNKAALASTATIDSSSEPDAPQTWLSFNGRDNYVEIPSLKLDLTQPLTLEVWATPRGEHHRVNVMTWLGPRWISLFTGDGGWGVATLSDDSSQAFWKSTEHSVGYRQHVAGVWQDGVASLFVNGQPLHLVKADLQRPGTEGGLFLGGVPVDKIGSAHWFEGDIDEVRVSKTIRYRGAFSPPALFAKDAETLALYRFDEGRGTELKDASGHGHRGTIVGAAWASATQTSALKDSNVAQPALVVAPFSAAKATAH